jgi:preprotein translocase subunit SecG
MKITRLLTVIFLAATLLLSSCANSNHPKKCNGKRGTKVPMGVI